MNELKTLQEEEKAIIIGGIVMTCGNTFDENGKEMSARLGDYICYVVEQERQKSYTLGIMKGVELVEGVVTETSEKSVGNGTGIFVAMISKDEILSNITNLKQELK